MKVKIVYFANLIPKLWEPIIIEQLESLKKLDLYNNSTIYMSVISNDEELRKLKDLINNKFSKIKLKNIYKENLFEYPGIKTIYQIAEDDDNEVILYFHSKGITSNQHDTRRFMFKNTIENYKEYLDEFKNNSDLDVAGYFPHKDGFCYYNFLWMRSSYVRNYCQKPEISDNRFIWETWVGKEFSRKKNIITFSSLIGYTQLKNSDEIWIAEKIYKKEPYKKISQIKNIENNINKNTENNLKYLYSDKYIIKQNYELLLKNYELLLKNYELLKQNYELLINNKDVESTVLEPTKESVLEPTKESVLEPTKESTVLEPTKESVLEPTLESVLEPTKESVLEPTKESVLEPVLEPSKEPVLEYIIKPVKINSITELNNVNKPKLIKKEMNNHVCKLEETTNDVRFKQTKRVHEFIKKIADNEKIFIDLSYERLNNEIESMFKKVVSISPKQNNEKLVQIKNNSNQITLKELLFNNVYKENEKICGIYCNMDGEEDKILEDLLHHIFINKIELLLKVNIDLKKYNYLLNYFIVNGHKELNNYITLSPRRNNDLQMVKKNMSVLIIGYNQYTYISKMVKQIEKYTNDIIIVDNNSTYEPLLNYYSTYKYSLLKMEKNYGHKVYEQDFLKGIFGELFIITDPDLELNNKLPQDFISNMVKISNQYKAGRVGFALEISSPNIRSDLTYAGMPLKLWEGRFWQAKIPNNNYELYNAAIDTTFCLLNTKYNYNGLSIRIAGNYTCKHLPWYINYHNELLEDEYTKYLENNISTNFWEDKFKINKKHDINWITNKVKPTEILILGKNDLEEEIKNKFKEVYVENNSTKIKEILFNLYNKKNKLNLSLIYCNYDGKEEDFFEDLLYLCYINKIKLLIKININNWKDKTLKRYESLLKIFTIYENNEIYKYDNTKLSNNLLFFELNNNISKDVFKRNMTIVIIGFNQYTYIKNMVKQVEKYTNDIVIIDNNSTFPELIKYYETEYKYTLLKMDKNYGHKVYEKEIINYLIGDVYILTDPDLELNKNLPNNFIEEMINISNYFEAERVGFALLIDSDDIREDVTSFGKSIIEFEKQYWMCKFYYPKHELYSAAIDTTFCLINKQNKGGHYRIAGDYVCKHLPWHKNFEKELIKGEFEYYKKNNISTNYWK